MKKLLLTAALALFCSPNAFGQKSSKIQFFCESNGKPSYEFPIDSSGSVHAITSGHFSQQLPVNEVHLINGDVKVTLNPFHHFCSIQIQYVNHTKNVFKNDDAILFSESATLTSSCEGDPIHSNVCSINVKSFFLTE